MNKKMIFFVFFVLFSSLAYAATDRTTYVLGDMVNIYSEKNADIEILSLSTNELYKFLGDIPDTNIKFIPKHAGEYTLTIYYEDETITSFFNVVEPPPVYYYKESSYIFLEKKIFQIGEEVNIFLNNIK